MDKSILKKFAIESRQDLMEKIKNKINTFYIYEEFINEQKGDLYILSNEKHSLSLTNDEYKKRELLIKRIKELSLEQVIEEAAYTWFNRIIAIRYMEINDMLPLTKDNQSLGIRVLSSKDNTPDPEILKFTNLVNPDLDIDFKKEKYAELKDDNEKFKYVLLLVCKKLGRVIPQVFDGVTDYIDILIPDNLLNDTGFITKVINEVPEDNYNQVEIIGWLYQYYNQVEKDKVMSQKKAHSKKDIPYATQIFTPDWVVKYMVENSLGKYCIEHIRGLNYSNFNWKYFIDDQVKNKEEINIKEMKFIDPCCGSGHILVYAFEVFYEIYKAIGYKKDDIATDILTNNLYGLDIDDRAGQLSILSVILKAREYDKWIFNKGIISSLNIMSISESNSINDCLYNEILNNDTKNIAGKLIDNFKDAKEIGSLLKINNCIDTLKLRKTIENDKTIFGIDLRDKFLPLIKVFNILNQKYDVLVTNPPYMNSSNMPNNLKKYLEKNYKDGKNDLCTAFMLVDYIKENGILSMINQQSWMFLGGFESLRKDILNKYFIDSFLHLGIGTFGADFGTCSFVIRKMNSDDKSKFIRLTEYKTSVLKEENIHNNSLYYFINQKSFYAIPGCTLSYWITEKMINNFSYNDSIGKKYISGGRNKTHNDEKYIRLHWEVIPSEKWVKYAKGGEYRKWYGNIYYVVNWSDSAKDEYKSHGGLLKEEYKECEGLSWSIVTSYKPSFRLKENNTVFSSVSPTIIYGKTLEKYALGFLNSIVAEKMLELVNSTLATNVSDVLSLPYKEDNNIKSKVESMVEQNIKISKGDWDMFETSWDFQAHPLIKYKTGQYIRDLNEKQSFYLYSVFDDYRHKAEIRFNKLKENEEELNRIFIDIYGLQDELTPEVEDKDITIRKADKEREIKSLISYAVGCMFGRYSLDKDGLIYAGGDFDSVYQKFKKKDGGWAGASLSNYKILNDNGNEIDLSFEVDNDNIIPITDEAYFGDDIVERFKNFIKVVYGKDTYNENMDFIAETLGKKGTETSEDTIRRYFLNDFFNDHCKIYQKRPIYWLFDSGKKNGFKALVYMHRYNENLIPKVRLDYLHRVQTTYEKLLSDVNYKLTTDLSMTDKKAAQNRQADLNAKLNEIKEYDEKIAHIANQRISIDLDDGVKVNYDRFKDILAKVK